MGNDGKHELLWTFCLFHTSQYHQNSVSSQLFDSFRLFHWEEGNTGIFITVWMGGWADRH